MALAAAVLILVPAGGAGAQGPITLTLAPESATNDLGSPHTVTATLTENGDPLSGKTIEFTVAGANTKTGTGTTDVKGQATFEYTGTNIGDDRITACYHANPDVACGGAGNPVAGATKTWLAADLRLTKTAGAGSVTVGDDITYTIVAKNVGNATAFNPIIGDKLPESATFVSATSDKGTCENGLVLICTVSSDELAPEESVTVTVVVKTTAARTLTNIASAGSDGRGIEPTPDDNTADAVVTVNPVQEGSADLTLTKTAAPLVDKGAALSYSLAVTNHGPSAATAVTLTDKLPSGVSFTSASASQGSCSGGGTVTCSLGTVKAGSSVTVTIVVTATSTGNAFNQAAVTAAETDPHPGDNTASVTTRISPRSDLGISGTVTPDAVRIGGDLTYHIVVKNAGPDTAEGTLVPLTIPAGATLVSVTPSQGICVPGGTVLCFLGMIASGGSATVDLVLRSSASGHLVVSPTVSSDGTDSNSANNATTLVGSVAESFDLRMEMTATPEKVGTGDWITYTITVTNLGPGTADGVKVVDPLPDTVTFVSCETTQGECTGSALLKVAAGRSVEARLGSLGPGSSGTVKILGRATSPGTATNSATVSGSGEDPTLSGNNESSAQTPVSHNQFSPPADVPPPVFNQSVDAAPVSGTVRFRRPGSNVFEILTAGDQFPLGTEFDTTNGKMILTSAADTTGAVQTAEFFDGFFVVTQTTTARATAARKATAVTDLTLTRGDFSVCKGARKFAGVERKPPRRGKSTTTRQLWGRGTGHFRTKGKYSSAAVRGTYWLTADRCDGTLTSVREGSVTVRDFVRKKTVIVRAGQSYLARKP